MRYTSVLRAHCGHAGAKFPVRILAGVSPPEVTGQYGGWETRGGTPVRYPSAYAKVGWSNLVYRCSSIQLTVGFDWLAVHMPIAAMQFVGLKKRKIRVYQSAPSAVYRRITEVSKHEI